MVIQESLFDNIVGEVDVPKHKKLTAKAALCKALLDGKTLNIKNCFTLIGLTNCPREISRMIEKPFEVRVTRIRREGESRYGQSVSWVDYRLDKFLDRNKDGIKKMYDYINSLT